MHHNRHISSRITNNDVQIASFGLAPYVNLVFLGIELDVFPNKLAEADLLQPGVLRTDAHRKIQSPALSKIWPLLATDFVIS